jgi:hypothetical protein
MPGQEWSNDAARCIGTVECPDGWTSNEQSCVRICADGKTAVDGAHCCFPGQTFVGDEDRGECRGTPRCASPYVQEGDTCVSGEEAEKRRAEKDAAAARERARARVAYVGQGRLLWSFTHYRVATDAGVSARVTDFYALSFHAPGLPIEAHAGFGSGKMGSANGSPGSELDAFHATGGVALAPFSWPNAATSSFSVFNPSVGVAVHYINADDVFTATSSQRSTSLAAEVSNAFMYVARADADAKIGFAAAFHVGYLHRLVGASAFAPSSGFYVGLMFGPAFN